ncbi:hypothetical protein JL722_50 [Aureococcus anophagefferens]|nr:hypothetical protein JL722_50 [Aureococcus anophagefferens]
MEQGFASDLFGATLASDTLVALYAAFTVGCFFAPCVVNFYGAKPSLVAGAAGYASLSVAAFAYAASGDAAWASGVVVAAGALNGVAAALLWTAQGQIYLAIAAADDRADAGRLFSVFWCLFNASAVAGGLVTFAYFSTSSSGGDAPLYALFTLFIVLGASAATLLAPPPKGDEPLLGDKDDAADHVPKPAFCAAALVEARATLALFTTRRALTLAPSSGTRASPRPTNWTASWTASSGSASRASSSLASIPWRWSAPCSRGGSSTTFRGRRARTRNGCWRSSPRPRRAYGVAAWLEALAAERADDDPVAVGFDASAACWLATTAVAALWGFADATIQTAALAPARSGAEADLARSVAFYKFVQSAGYCGGFALLPSSRCAYEAQLGLGAGAGALGVCLALLELPGDVR